MRVLSLVLAILGIWVTSCNDCTNCEPFTEEPNILVRFYNLPDTTRRIIIIDSVNQVAAAGLRHFSDTTYSFKFPLDMNNDVSEFNLIFRDTANLESYLTNTITVTYSRQFIRRDDNYIVVECDISEFSSDYTGNNLECKETETNQCISNDAKASIYN
jgi:hypothetical protein